MAGFKNSFPMTEKLYLKDTYLFNTEAKVYGILKEESKTAVVLDRSIFHPQGGGQPSDVGVIKGQKSVFEVNMVKDIQGIVHHYGDFKGEAPTSEFDVEENVILQIDEAARRFHAKLHSAGHALDAAVLRAGYILKPTKGYHFKDGSYVEYEGTMPQEKREEFLTSVNEQLAILVKEGLQTEIDMLSKASAQEEVGSDAVAHLAEDQEVRVVKIGGVPCPCGGTHVSSTSELGSVKVTKLKAKKNTLRLSYQMEH